MPAKEGSSEVFNGKTLRWVQDKDDPFCYTVTINGEPIDWMALGERDRWEKKR